MERLTWTLLRDFIDLLFKVREFCTLLFKVFQFILSKVYHVGNWRLYDKTYLNYFKIQEVLNEG